MYKLLQRLTALVNVNKPLLELRGFNQCDSDEERVGRHKPVGYNFMSSLPFKCSWFEIFIWNKKASTIIICWRKTPLFLSPYLNCFMAERVCFNVDIFPLVIILVVEKNIFNFCLALLEKYLVCSLLHVYQCKALWENSSLFTNYTAKSKAGNESIVLRYAIIKNENDCNEWRFTT